MRSLITGSRDDWATSGLAVARTLGVVALVLAVGAVVVAAVPGLVGMDESYVVRSDSMSPNIGAGSVVFVTADDVDSLDSGEVITFRQSGGETLVTHRIVEVVEQDGERRYRTKGDANEEADGQLVRPAAVVGTVAFSVPLLGYLLSFAQSKTGIVVLVVVPATVLIVDEAWRLYRDHSNGQESDG